MNYYQFYLGRELAQYCTAPEALFCDALVHSSRVICQPSESHSVHLLATHGDTLDKHTSHMALGYHTLF